MKDFMGKFVEKITTAIQIMDNDDYNNKNCWRFLSS